MFLFLPLFLRFLFENVGCLSFLHCVVGCYVSPRDSMCSIIVWPVPYGASRFYLTSSLWGLKYAMILPILLAFCLLFAIYVTQLLFTCNMFSVVTSVYFIRLAVYFANCRRQRSYISSSYGEHDTFRQGGTKTCCCNAFPEGRR